MDSKKYFKTVYVLIFVFLIVIILSVTITIRYIISASPKVFIKTDLAEYKFQDPLKIKITNNLATALCFSSCYPYYIEKNEDDLWKGYNYAPCQNLNLVKQCCDTGKAKAFSTQLPKLEAGIYRLAIPVCENCNAGQAFKDDKYLYSNSFTIK